MSKIEVASAEDPIGGGYYGRRRDVRVMEFQVRKGK